MRQGGAARGCGVRGQGGRDTGALEGRRWSKDLRGGAGNDGSCMTAAVKGCIVAAARQKAGTGQELRPLPHLQSAAPGT